MADRPPYLTDEEVFEICRPRRQGAAQIRYLRQLGIKVARRGDGTPLVWRRDVEGPQSGGSGAGATVGASNEPRWTRHA
jgi:rhodanese-related sulfurtransferase